MQAEKPGEARRYANTLDAFAQIARKEGLPGLYRGVGPTTQRAMLLTATQLASYDHTKHLLLQTPYFEENTLTHLVVSMIAGFFCATTTAPVDNIKSRYMNQKFLPSGKGELYTSTMDCFTKTLRAEGFLGIYKGWFPNWMRIGSRTFLMACSSLFNPNLLSPPQSCRPSHHCHLPDSGEAQGFRGHETNLRQTLFRQKKKNIIDLYWLQTGESLDPFF